MTSFKWRIDSFYDRQRSHSLQLSFQMVWAIAAAACYLMTPPAHRITIFASLFGIFGAIVLAANIRQAWRVRRVVHRLRSMAPDDRDQVLGRQLSPEVREFYERRLAAEGAVDVDGFVERFPFSRVDRRETLAVFWGATTIATVGLAVGLGVSGLEERWRGPALVVGIGAVLVMFGLARRFQRLASVIELTPFAIIEVRADGCRRWLYWNQPLVLRKRGWLRRLELAPQGAPGHIAIDYGRVGFDRLVAVILERGGFHTPSHAA